MMGWIFGATLCGVLLSVAAVAAERAAAWLGLPRRWAWAAAMAGTVALPALAAALPGALPRLPLPDAPASLSFAAFDRPIAATAAPVVQPTAGSTLAPRTLPPLGRVLGAAWMAASLAIAAAFGVALARHHLLAVGDELVGEASRPVVESVGLFFGNRYPRTGHQPLRHRRHRRIREQRLGFALTREQVEELLLVHAAFGFGHRLKCVAIERRIPAREISGELHTKRTSISVEPCGAERQQIAMVEQQPARVDDDVARALREAVDHHAVEGAEVFVSLISNRQTLPASTALLIVRGFEISQPSGRRRRPHIGLGPRVIVDVCLGDLSEPVIGAALFVQCLLQQPRLVGSVETACVRPRASVRRDLVMFDALRRADDRRVARVVGRVLVQALLRFLHDAREAGAWSGATPLAPVREDQLQALKVKPRFVAMSAERLAQLGRPRRFGETLERSNRLRFGVVEIRELVEVEILQRSDRHIGALPRIGTSVNYARDVPRR
jgi:hypothetical protein